MKYRDVSRIQGYYADPGNRNNDSSDRRRFYFARFSLLFFPTFFNLSPLSFLSLSFSISFYHRFSARLVTNPVFFRRELRADANSG